MDGYSNHLSTLFSSNTGYREGFIREAHHSKIGMQFEVKNTIGKLQR